MRKISFFLIVFIFLGVSYSFAQLEKAWGDPHAIEKFVTEASKNPDYKKFRTEVEAFSKSANGKKTNASAVKALFTRNSALLKSLYTKSGLEAPKPMSNKPLTLNTQALNSIKSSMLLKMLLTHQDLIRTETPSYEDSWSWSDQGGMANIYPDTSDSQFSTGKITFMYEGTTGIKKRLGQYFQGFFQNFKVPSKPEIIAAEIKFEYSFLYLGWDTYGARIGMDLIVEANDKINGTAYNELPTYDYSYYTQGPHRWKKAATLYPMDTIDTDFGEFHASGNSSFTIEGYVNPGSTINLKFGPGFTKNTVRGLNSCYHYAEFILKKITIRYFKSAN